MLRKKSILLLGLSVILTVMAFFPIKNKEIDTKADFALSVCKNIYAGGLSGRSSVSLDVDLLPNAKNRTYTLQELFQNSLYISRFYGENPSGDILLAAKDRGLTKGLSEEASKRIKDVGDSFLHCTTAWGKTLFTENALSYSSNTTNFIKVLTTSLFNSKFICENPENPNGGCINLVKIIGGTKTDTEGGIIGKLGNGIYFPLVTFGVLISALYLLWIGIVKKQFRETLNAFGWMLFATVLAIFIITKPNMVARAPQKINNVFVGCLLDGMNGKNCLNTSSSSKNTFSDGCESDMDSEVSDKAAIAVNSLNCGIWKSFQLNNWTRSQFAYNFNDLYVKNAPSGVEPYKLPAGIDPELFCVNLHSSMSANDILKNPNNTRVFDNKVRICNIAAAQLAISSGIEKDEYFAIRDALAKTAASDPQMFNPWGWTSGNYTSAITSMIATFFAAISLILITIKGHIFSLLATIVIAMGPVFCLFAIHPGRGKRIFLGWVESLIGYILKFMATAFMIILTLLVFSAVIQATTGWTTVLASIILSLAFKQYQNEFVKVIGKVEMGGAKVSKALDEKVFDKGKELQDKTKKATDKVKDVAGAGIGSKLAGGSFKEGMKDGIKRSLSRSSNPFIRSAGREYMRTGNKINNMNEKAYQDLKEEKARNEAMESLKSTYEPFIEDISNISNNSAETVKAAREANKTAKQSKAMSSQTAEAQQKQDEYNKVDFERANQEKAIKENFKNNKAKIEAQFRQGKITTEEKEKRLLENSKNYQSQIDAMDRELNAKKLFIYNEYKENKAKDAGNKSRGENNGRGKNKGSGNNKGKTNSLPNLDDKVNDKKNEKKGPLPNLDD